MPLSEEELRMLEQMERALLAEDPKLASALRGSRMRSTARKKVLLSAVGFVLGIVVMMTGVVLRMELIGILGFVVMLACAVLGLSALRSRTVVVPDSPAGAEEPEGLTVIEGGRRPRRPKSKSRPSGSFMDRMEARWRRRRDGGNGGY